MSLTDSAAPSRPGEKGDQFPTGPEAISFALGELTGKVSNVRDDIRELKDNVQTSFASTKTETTKRFEDLEERMDVLEKWHTKMTALYGAGGIFLGWIAQWVIHNVHQLPH